MAANTRVEDETRGTEDKDHDSQGPSDPDSMGVYLSPKSARYTKVGVDLCEDHIVCVVAVGLKFLYVIPGFDVLAVELRHIQVKGSLKIGDPEETFDLFIKNDCSLKRTYPCEMIMNDVTVIKEDEFKLGVITDELCLPPQGVIVVWEWEWIIENDLYTSVTHVSETEGSIDHISETSLAATSDSDETNCNTPVDNRQYTSTVTFKCIGAQHDPLAQSVLRRVSGYLDEGQEVPVNIYPEPTNQYDAKAIAFKCWIDNDWHRIGYVVREALDSVHDARESGSILEVKFSWAKYLVTWMRSGPGYYAGINITRVGQWNTAVHQCASTR